MKIKHTTDHRDFCVWLKVWNWAKVKHYMMGITNVHPISSSSLKAGE